jgi:carbon-monoxide dehydrogenase medium subunit
MSEIAFFRPQTLAQAIDRLAADGEARCIAGGQTLVAMLNANLIAPSALVSLADLAELRGITTTANGIRIGAMTSHRELAAEPRLIGGQRVLAEAAAQIGHLAIRTMGTIGGSLCHGDAAADYPAAIVAADATLELHGPRGSRRVGAAGFFKDFLTTDLAPDEILVAVELPKPPPQSAGHYLKFARVEGDFATVSVAVALAVADGRCTAARLALGGCGPVPVRSDAAEKVLRGSPLDEDALDRAGALLAAASDPLDDIRGSAEYRRLVIPRLVRRAVAAAAARIGTGA